MINTIKKVAPAPFIIVYLFTALFSAVPFSYAEDSDEQVFYYLHDNLGSIDAVIDEDGNVVERRDYLPYGEERLNAGESDEVYGYTGKEEDDETGLYYYGARYYDPTIGRFTQIDPLVLGETEKPLADVLNNPQESNGYSYTLNNPLKYIDPSGKFKVETGEIEKGDTEKVITDDINKKWNTDYDWGKISNLNSGVIGDKSLSDLVGSKLIPNTDVPDVTDELNAEMERWKNALSYVKGSGLFDTLSVFYEFATNPNMGNLKERTGSIFHTKEQGKEGYVFGAEKTSFDAPANILYGYVGKSIGLTDIGLYYGAGANQVGKVSALMRYIFTGDIAFGDDPQDNLYIRKGINIYDK